RPPGGRETPERRQEHALPQAQAVRDRLTERAQGRATTSSLAFAKESSPEAPGLRSTARISTRSAPSAWAGRTPRKSSIGRVPELYARTSGRAIAAPPLASSPVGLKDQIR